MKYSLVIVTYEDRFEDYFKPIVSQIRSQRNDVEISLQINGNYDKSLNEGYRKSVLRFISNYDNIIPQFYTKFTSLAKMWNRGIQNCSNDVVLVLNDDVKIFDGFFDFIDDTIYENCFFTINNIFSHFVISKNIIESLNWFDERFLGVGKEDRDIQIKYKESNINTELIKSYHIDTNSDNNIPKYSSKYSKFNETFFIEKHKKQINSELKLYPYYNFEINNYGNLGNDPNVINYELK